MHSSSDSEDDPDYVPPVDNDSQSAGDEPDPKRARLSSPLEEDRLEEKKKRDAAWAEFQASLSTPQPKASASDAPPRMVKIEKRYRFAGEDVVEVKEVPEHSDEAKKWPRWHPARENDKDTTTPTVGPSPKPTASSSTPPSTSTISKPPAKRPGPRKPKTTLAPLPSAQKAKKLTTLDKSAMDWRGHVQMDGQPGLKDELEANRRGGGYLEKVEFLQRVEERKADALDASTSKRRRG
ncbi:bucentaur or craniofacial development-domain-containing protein [Rhodofomes roseus]|uniref:SWR1-complex protein 5 n=1 Tax=Rhodofomes roseus TaxID=34475 RepID=A0A4Y9YDW0_9APHY|nr:bucentaur or craniofacial development-domain-containing protein [Rhodofomes roseus]KAH9835266.1 bucentaur or craniofacial development-domain-containing protein [Rhodofomes roseus]TFY59069.1 hypothetical protein EVJ58_g6014 [Rhodofomes roseus]